MELSLGSLLSRLVFEPFPELRPCRPKRVHEAVRPRLAEPGSGGVCFGFRVVGLGYDLGSAVSIAGSGSSSQLPESIS